MAYRITYHWEKARELEPKRTSFGRMIPWLLVLAALIAARVFFPDILRALFYPLGDEATSAALGEMMTQIGAGTSIPDAFAAFCREILALA